MIKDGTVRKMISEHDSCCYKGGGGGKHLHTFVRTRQRA